MKLKKSIRLRRLRFNNNDRNGLLGEYDNDMRGLQFK